MLNVDDNADWDDNVVQCSCCVDDEEVVNQTLSASSPSDNDSGNDGDDEGAEDVQDGDYDGEEDNVDGDDDGNDGDDEGETESKMAIMMQAATSLSHRVQGASWRWWGGWRQ